LHADAIRDHVAPRAQIGERRIGIERAYGLFAANPFGVSTFTGDKTQNSPTELETGKSLRFRYRLIIHPGDAASANIPAEWDKYVKGK